MAAPFATPALFLEYVKNTYSDPPSAGPIDAAFASKTIHQLSEHAPDLLKYSSDQLLEMHVAEMVNELRASATQDIVSRIDTSVAFGVLPTGVADAICTRSNDGKCAILVGSGLMTLLHKFIKLTLGRLCTDAVIYCSRKEANKLTGEDFKQYLDELISEYRSHGTPRGALVKFDFLRNPALAVTHGTFLEIAEMFVLCHELGHFLNNDFDDDGGFSHSKHAQFQVFVENQNHSREFMADLAGYGLLQTTLSKREHPPDTRFVFGALITLFNLLHLISVPKKSIWQITRRDQRTSLSHPEPIERLLNIVGHFHGQELKSKLDRSYSSPWALLELFLTPGNP